jgi:hypothetical protein
VVINIRVTTTGQDLSGLERDVRRKLTQRIGGLLSASVVGWRRLVISTTWYSPIPSPTSKIIGSWRKTDAGYVFIHGWINYAGDNARADYRLSLRDAMFSPQLLARIDRIMQSTLGPVGGTDPAGSGGGQ